MRINKVVCDKCHKEIEPTCDYSVNVKVYRCSGQIREIGADLCKSCLDSFLNVAIGLNGKERE